MHETFVDSQGRNIILRMELDGSIQAYFSGELIGSIEWTEFSSGLDAAGEDVFGALITHAFLNRAPGFQRCGIGTRIVELIGDWAGLEVFVAPDRGFTRSDGAHPTGAGLPFNTRLVERGLASWVDGESD